MNFPRVDEFKSRLAGSFYHLQHRTVLHVISVIIKLVYTESTLYTGHTNHDTWWI